jgi:hypothetical protein
MKSGAKLEMSSGMNRQRSEGLVNEPCKMGSKKLKVWSAGCSTDEQPYTLSMFLLEEKGKPLKDCTFEIQAAAECRAEGTALQCVGLGEEMRHEESVGEGGLFVDFVWGGGVWAEGARGDLARVRRGVETCVAAIGGVGGGDSGGEVRVASSAGSTLDE